MAVYLVAGLATAAGAATVRALPWSQDMVRSRAVMPQGTMMLLAPPNTLALNRQRVMDRLEADERLKNPADASPEVLKQGHTLFDTYCRVCHGADGRGSGTVAKYFRRVSDLT